ncbi:protein N-terminal asparagine amidohydrolase-like isoform X2 [Mercenaria mercenaria]|uniref:protein N-terminal asparagine amidohydrolase-like isoform X2 n=1 Tax=Mercenaria mercenaria TaxID=6596 RepID=UPI00234F01A7|nr:protein N-terminal asparagine amidohydrolase-like isoform X2 [Mercenaria mercenaria]
MPLFVDEEPFGSSLKTVAEFLQRYVKFKEGAVQLSTKPTKEVPPHGLLYVGQREMAVISPEDECIQVLGTDDATTCHIAILRHTASLVTGMAHFDGSGLQLAVQNLIDTVLRETGGKQWGRLELTLVGGFKDSRGMSEELSFKLFDLNTRIEKGIPYPVIYGLAVIVQTGEIFPAKFQDRGPEQPLRSARHFTGSEEVINIYDNRKKQLVIGPFDYSTMDEIDLLCRLPDPIIREHLSTSPEQEPKHFEASVRAALVQIRDFPDPLKSVFKGKGIYFKKEADGRWTKVD